MHGISLKGDMFVLQEEAGRLRNWNCTSKTMNSFSPQQPVCTASWRTEDLPQGAFAVNTSGQVVNVYWVHEEGFRVDTLEIPGKMVPSSLLVALNQKMIYGVDENNQLVCITRKNGELQHQVPDVSFDIQSGSLVCAAGQDAGDGLGSDLYAVDIDHRLIHLVWVNGRLTAELVPGGENVIAGSLVSSLDGATVLGIQGDVKEGTGNVVQIRTDGTGLSQLECKTTVLAGSLVWGGGDDSQDRSAPGFYGVDTVGNLVNFLQVGDEWEVRNIESASVIPGTLARHPDGEAVYAISLEGRTLEICQEHDRFSVRDLDQH